MHKGLASLAVAATMWAGAAHADVITWIDWTSTTASPTGAVGVAGDVTATYVGEVTQFFTNYPSWDPDSTFSGGTVDNPPPSDTGIVGLNGGNTNIKTLTFSKAILDPVFAIWSLGQNGTPASFVFNTNALITLESGGPSAEYPGPSISVLGNVVSGAEGAGVIRLHGTFTSISWTNPQAENWYGFTAGHAGVVPEPASWALMIVGFGALGSALRVARRRQGEFAPA